MGEVAGASILLEHCVKVDACTQKNQRCEKLPLGNWPHCSVPALTVPHDRIEGVFAPYHIGLAYVLLCIALELCKPNFSALHESGSYMCNEQTLETMCVMSRL